MGHYSRVCRSKQQKSMKINNVDYDKSTDSSSEETVFHVAYSSKIPAVHAILFGKKTRFVVDSGSTVNIIHASSCPRGLNLSQPCPKIIAYGSDKPLAVNGYFSTYIEYKGKRAYAKLYVTNSNKKTAQALGLIQFAFSASLNIDRPTSAQSTSSITDEYSRYP